jgi:hypothetical protein
VARTCESCTRLTEKQAIHTADELSRLLQLIKPKLAARRLKSLSHPGSGSRYDLVEPWPEFIEHYFVCSDCGQAFRLAVQTKIETVERFEGRWEPFTYSEPFHHKLARWDMRFHVLFFLVIAVMLVWFALTT